MTASGPRRRRGRILISILLLLFSIGVVPLLWTSYRLVTSSRDSLELTQREMQQDKARGLSSQVGLYVESLRDQVAAVSRTLEIDADRQPFSELVARVREQEALKRYLQDDANLVYVGVVDTGGNAAVSGLQLQDAAIQEWLQKGFERGRHGTSMVSVPLVSQSLQEPVIVLGEPVRAGERVLGVVLAVASLQPVRQMTLESGEGGLLDVYLVDNRGHLIAHSDLDVPLQGDMSEIDIVRFFRESGQRTGETVPFSIPAEGGARKMLGTYWAVPDDSGWGAIVQVDEKTAYYDADVLFRQSMVLVSVVTALAVVLGTLFAGQISRPIRRLADGARRLAGGDYGTRVAIRSENEVGVLADAFNVMGEEIEKAIEQIRQAARENKELFMGSIRMLANAIDEKDPYTRGHSERVAYYSACVAKHLGMPAEEVEKVHLSGIIHDVGKIGIEDKILRKASALTDDEYEIMKQHPTKGLHILAAVPLLKEKAGAGLMHHENVDGSGYPEGLKGDDIPFLGRIVSVADAFDAMTTDRPYSKAMTFEAAVARLKFLSGKKFDPDCVDAFDKAFAAGDVTPAKARQASMASRQFEIDVLMGGGTAPEAAVAAADASAAPV
ncbi:MAG: HD domain-containing protein [Acidobacteria bacterium]|jgi:HD-GYP domain-containing protein (c-di-GMP phosphodiesterase class II)|nr:HD domain-containing protein [Acidobacteriota bacterium]